MDGTVSYIEFDYSEIGIPQTKKEREEFFFKKYSYDINASVGLKQQSSTANIQKASGILAAAGTAAKKNNDSMKFVENVDILLAQEQKQQPHTGMASISENSPPRSMNFEVSCSVSRATPSKLAIITEVSFINHKRHKTIHKRLNFGLLFFCKRTRGKSSVKCRMAAEESRQSVFLSRANSE